MLKGQVPAEEVKISIEYSAKLLAIARNAPEKESSNVATYGYDKLMQVITVEFKDDDSSVYAYMDCTEKDFSDFKGAKSMGQHVHKVLKKQHNAVKLT